MILASAQPQSVRQQQFGAREREMGRIWSRRLWDCEWLRHATDSRLRTATTSNSPSWRASQKPAAPVLHDLDHSLLRRMQRQGAVRTWIDRRTDLYRVTWSDNGNEPGEV
jgi:hypothetical protein